MKKLIDARLRILAIFLIIWGGFITVTLWYMQVVKGESYQVRAVQNLIRLVRIPPPRGIIFDRNGTVLADNRPSFDVVVNPTEIEDRERLIAVLRAALNIQPEHLNQRLDTFRDRPFEPVRVAADIGIVAATILEEMSPELPGVAVQVNPVRNYPYGFIPVHLLGYVGQISPRELEELKDSGYRAQDDIGKMGVEKAYDRYLRGQAGVEQLQVNARGYRDKVLSRKEPRPGEDIYLTLDIRAQEILDELLGEWKGAAVVIDPRDGDLLAMVSHPSFDPNLLIRPVRREDAEKVFEDQDTPLLNRALAGEYPPGSPFKLVVALAGLASRIISPKKTYDCGGFFFLGRSTFRCWKPSGHGTLDLQQAIKHSCNIYFYNLGLEVGVDGISRKAREIGLGEPSGVEIKRESGGLIPDRVWKKKVFKESWYPGDTVNISIGQGYLLVTPIQMAGLGCIIANQGTLYQPRIVKRITSPDGDIIKEPEPVIRKKMDIPKWIWRELLSGMIRVVNEEHGTGRAAAHDSITVAGKTGTVQVGSPPEYGKHAWFLALAPADDPEVVLAILLEDAESGGKDAAPLAGEFMRRYFSIPGFQRNEILE